jgi:excisionase family DNA binding protein
MKENLNGNLAFSIDEFCKLHSISRAKFYLMLQSGEAPQTMQVGRRRLISQEAALRWRQRMEQVQGAQK